MVVNPHYDITFEPTCIFNYSKENMSSKASSYLFQSHFVGPNALYQRNSERVQLIGLMCFIDDRQRYSEAQTFQVSHFLGQGDDFR